MSAEPVVVAGLAAVPVPVVVLVVVPAVEIAAAWFLRFQLFPAS